MVCALDKVPIAFWIHCWVAMMLAKAQKQLLPASCCQGSCLCMILLAVPIPGVGMAKEMTFIISSSQSCWDATSMVTTGDSLWIRSEAAGDGNGDAAQWALNTGKQYGVRATALLANGPRVPPPFPSLTTEHQGTWCSHWCSFSPIPDVCTAEGSWVAGWSQTGSSFASTHMP